MNFKLALAQLQIEPGAHGENLARARDAIAEGAKAGAQLVLLPEALPFGWTDPLARELADAIPAGGHCMALREAARQHGLYVCSGLVERAGERLYNSAVLIEPSGEVLLHHRKIYELEIAHTIYALGDRLSVARTPLGTIGVMICADGFAPAQVIGRTLALMGADIIVSPCAWAVPADHDNATAPYGQLWLDSYGAVARDYRVWMAGCSNVGPIRNGPWKGRKCIGCSMVIGPDGEPAARAPYGEDAAAILYSEVKPEARPGQGTTWEDFQRAQTRSPKSR